MVEPAGAAGDQPLDGGRQGLRVHRVRDQPAAMRIHRHDPVVQHGEALGPGRVEPACRQSRLIHADEDCANHRLFSLEPHMR